MDFLFTFVWAIIKTCFQMCIMMWWQTIGSEKYLYTQVLYAYQYEMCLKAIALDFQEVILTIMAHS